MHNGGQALGGWMRRILFVLVSMASLSLASGVARAHATGTNYLKIESPTATAQPRLTWDLAITELDWSVDFDANRDRGIVWEEVAAAKPALERLVRRSLDVRRAGKPCVLSLQDLHLVRHAEAPYASLAIGAHCPEPGELAVRSSLFFGTDAGARTLIAATTVGGRFDTALSPTSPEWREPDHPTPWATFGRFVAQGTWHVWIGYDHIAFLILLLLPSVLRPAREGWVNGAATREVIRDLVKIVTAFTLAHSITLGLAATRTLTLPVRPIEIAIALTIVVAGLVNLVPSLARLRLGLAFGFGLVHGFGFANALAELGASGASLVPMLAGFNVGVELAQLSIVAVGLPMLLWSRRSTLYAARLMPAMSLATAMAGAHWLADRAM